MPAPAEQPEPSQLTPPAFRLRRLQIENFKAIENLDLDLPPPLMEDDPDVFVLGSKNGVGKTSLLEACALVFIGRTHQGLLDAGRQNSRYSFAEYFIRAGCSHLRLCTEVSFSRAASETVRNELILPRQGDIQFHWSVDVDRARFPALDQPRAQARVEEIFFKRLLSAVREPLALPGFIYMHSNRQIEHGPVAANQLDRVVPALFSLPYSGGWVKSELLHFLMTQAGLFENLRPNAVAETAAVLEELFRSFANAKLSKLRALPNNSFDIRVQPRSGGESFSFDALSSGQKEIIATLFQIWHHTREYPSIVLIDEPELHLNAEWQVKFVRLLFKLAPRNQYIFATHSEHIFRSVQEDRRILLGPRG